MLKKKLKIPSTHLIHTSDLTEFEKEKEVLNTEMIDYKAKHLKLEEKERQWEKETKFLKESEEGLKVKLATQEKELQEKGEVMEISAIVPNTKTNTASLASAMSQVKLRDVELTGLNKQNKYLEDMASKKEEEKKTPFLLVCILIHQFSLTSRMSV